MTYFTLDADNNITAHRTAEEAGAVTDGSRFSTQPELTKLSANWPADRLTEVWNSLPGVVAVKKFKDRKTGLTRIWKAIQTLQPAEAVAPVEPRNAHVAPAKGKAKRKATTAKQSATEPATASKKAQVVALLERLGGATLAEIMAVTGWQAHTVRGFISATLGKRMGLAVVSAKRDDGTRFYSISR